MSDLIDRQDAIDAMYRLEAEDIERYGCSIPEGFDAKPAVEALEALPSAEPEQKWIPVAEALPEECVSVLIQMDDGEMAVSQRRDMNYWDGYGRCGDIIAWMPLPELWRGEK